MQYHFSLLRFRRLLLEFCALVSASLASPSSLSHKSRICVPGHTCAGPSPSLSRPTSFPSQASPYPTALVWQEEDNETIGGRENLGLTGEHRPELSFPVRLRGCWRSWGQCDCSPPAPPYTHTGALTLQGEPQEDMLRAQQVLSSAGEFPFIFLLHSRQLQHPRVQGI